MIGPEHILAIDGGGSKTAAALLTPDGEEIARCRVGPANLYRDRVTGLAEIGRAWEELCLQAGLQSDRAADRTTRASAAGSAGCFRWDSSTSSEPGMPLDGRCGIGSAWFFAPSASVRSVT